MEAGQVHSSLAVHLAFPAGFHRRGRRLPSSVHSFLDVPFFAGVVFGFSAVLHVLFLSNHSEEKPGIMALSLATFRFSFLTLVSLLSLNKTPSLLGAVGGKERRFDESPAA